MKSCRKEKHAVLLEIYALSKVENNLKKNKNLTLHVTFGFMEKAVAHSFQGLCVSKVPSYRIKANPNPLNCLKSYDSLESI